MLFIEQPMSPKPFSVEPSGPHPTNQTDTNLVSKPPFWSKFWVNWLVVTLSYLGIFLMTEALKERGNYGVIFGSFLGLFVPIGFFTAAFEIVGNLTFRAVFALIIFVLTLIYTDKILYKFNFSPALKIFLNFIILLLLTLIIDVIIWGRWESWKILQNGGMGSFF